MKDENAKLVPSVESRSQEFVPVEGGPQATSSAELLLTIAYVLMWASVFGLAIFTYKRQARALARLDELEKNVEARDRSS